MPQRQRAEAKSQQMFRLSGVQCGSTQVSDMTHLRRGLSNSTPTDLGPNTFPSLNKQHRPTQSNLYVNIEKFLLLLFGNGIPILP